jgi:hypothetical protein
MSKKKVQPHPSTIKKNGADTIHGGPIDGDEFDPPEITEPNADEVDDGDDDAIIEEPPKTAIDKRFDDLMQKIETLQRDNENLRRAIPPSVQPQPEPEPEEDDVDWDTLIYENPKEALRIHGERVAKSVEQNLTRKYQQDKNEQRFWDKFYAKHKDLTDDRDIVELVLSKNLSTLANKPSDEAMDELADLTRRRIMRYSDNPRPRKGSRAVVEGGHAPTHKATPKQAEQITTLSSLIKARRAKRMGIQAT